MTTKFQEYDVFNLIDEEQGSETNALVSALAGVASGLIKVPEGVISLGAELIDLGFDTNTAAKVEKTFGVSERAKQSSIEKQKESIEEKFGLTAGVLENYYNFTSSGRAAELSEKTNKTFIGPIKKKTDRKGRGKYVTKNKFGLYFDPVNNVAVEVNADGSYVTLYGIVTGKQAHRS